MLLIGLYQSRELNTANWKIEQLQQDARQEQTNKNWELYDHNRKRTEQWKHKQQKDT